MAARTQLRLLPAPRSCPFFRQQIAVAQQFRRHVDAYLEGLRALGRRRARGRRCDGSPGATNKGVCPVFAAEVIAEIETLVGADAVEDWDFEAIDVAARRCVWLPAPSSMGRRRHLGLRRADGVGRVRAARSLRRPPG